jgi:hypothetical protein
MYNRWHHCCVCVSTRPAQGAVVLVVRQCREKEAMIDRRTLLRALLLLGPITALVSACKHRGPYEEKEDPFKREGGGY